VPGKPPGISCKIQTQWQGWQVFRHQVKKTFFFPQKTVLEKKFFAGKKRVFSTSCTAKKSQTKLFFQLKMKSRILF